MGFSDITIEVVSEFKKKIIPCNWFEMSVSVNIQLYHECELGGRAVLSSKMKFKFMIFYQLRSQ